MSIKQYILRMRKDLNSFRLNDKTYKQKKEELDQTRLELNETFSKLKNLEELFPDEEERNQMFQTLDESMTHLTELANLAEKDLENYLDQCFPEQRQRYPIIFKKFLEDDCNVDSLMHCLDTLTMVEQGQVSLEQAKEMGYRKFHHQ